MSSGNSSTIGLMLCVFWAASLGAEGPPAAPTRSVDDRLDFVITGKPLRQAIKTLIEEHHVLLMVEDRLLPDKNIDIECTSCSVEVLLGHLLEGTRLEAVRVGDQWIIQQRKEKKGDLRALVIRGRTRAAVRQGLVQVMSTDGRSLGQGITDALGCVLFTDLDPGEVIVTVNMQGYLETRGGAWIWPGRENRVTIELNEVEIPLQHMVVGPSQYELLGGDFANQFLTRQEIRQMPHLVDDVFRTLDQVPGVSTTDVSSDFRVRGGGPDEVLVVVDGAELPEPYHFKSLTGLLGVVDAETVDNLVLMSGAFPSRFGNKLSGVLEFESTTPRSGKTSSAGINTLNFNANTQGTFSDGRGSYLFNARSGYLDFVLRIVDDDDGHKEADFVDFFGKVQYRLNDFHNLSQHILWARDMFDVLEDWDRSDGVMQLSNTRAESLGAWLNLTSVWSASLASQSVVSFFTSNSQERAFDNADIHNVDVDYFGRYDIIQLKQDWEWNADPSHFVRFGWSYRTEDATLDYFSERTVAWPTIFRLNQGITDCFLKESEESFGFHVSDQIFLSDRVTADFGLRYDRQRQMDEEQFSPRVNLAWQLSPKTSLRFGAGRFHQPQDLHAIPIRQGVVDQNAAKQSDCYVLSVEHQFENEVLFSAEAYVKTGRRLWTYYGNFLDNFDFVPETQYDRVAIPCRSSESRGFDLVLRKRLQGSPKGSPWWWMANYSWNKTDHTVDRSLIDPVIVLPSSGVIPSPWDQRHTVKLMLGYSKNEKWQIAGAWQYHSGWPLSEVEVLSLDPNKDGPQLGVNVHWFADRTPTYHRLDLRFSRQVQYRNGHRLQFFLDITNAYNRDNLRGYGDVTYDFVKGGIETQMINQEVWLTILPTFGFWWRF